MDFRLPFLPLHGPQEGRERGCSVTGPGGHVLPAATLQLKTGENKTALEISCVPLPAHLTATALVLGVSEHISWQRRPACVLGDGASSAHKAPYSVRGAVVWPQEKEKQKVGGHAGSHSQDGHARDTCGLFYPQSMTMWCLESEQTGTPQAPEERKRKLFFERLQGPIVGSNFTTPRKMPFHRER